jgi:hypothetical protein
MIITGNLLIVRVQEKNIKKKKKKSHIGHPRFDTICWPLRGASSHIFNHVICYNGLIPYSDLNFQGA